MSFNFSEAGELIENPNAQASGFHFNEDGTEIETAPKEQEPPKRGFTDVIKDVGLSFMGGVHSGVGDAIGEGIQWAGDKIDSKSLQDIGETTRLANQDKAKEYQDAMTQTGKEMLNQQLFDGFKPVGKGVGDWLSGASLQAIQSLPGMIVTAPIGGVAARGIAKVGSAVLPEFAGALLKGGAGVTGGASAIEGNSLKAAIASRGITTALGERALSLAPTAIGYGGAEGVLAGAQNAAQTRSEIEQTPYDVLAKTSPVFNEYLKANGNDQEAARLHLAKDASEYVLRNTIVSTGGIGMLTGGGAMGMVDRAAQKAVKGSLLKEVAKGIGGGAKEEALQEFPQSGMEAYIQNKAKQEYVDPTNDPLKGTLSQAMQGGVVGGLSGAAFGGFGAIKNYQPSQQPPPSDGTGSGNPPPPGGGTPGSDNLPSPTDILSTAENDKAALEAQKTPGTPLTNAVRAAQQHDVGVTAAAALTASSLPNAGTILNDQTPDQPVAPPLSSADQLVRTNQVKGWNDEILTAFVARAGAIQNRTPSQEFMLNLAMEEQQARNTPLQNVPETQGIAPTIAENTAVVEDIQAGGLVPPSAQTAQVEQPTPIAEVYKNAISRKGVNDSYSVYRPVDTSEASVLKEKTGMDFDGYSHHVDEDGIRHALNGHGVPSEVARGQSPITEEDILRIPEVTNAETADSIERGRVINGLETIVYRKSFNGYVIAVEEVRDGRKRLALKTMWKTPSAPRATSEEGVAHTSETFGERLSTGNPNILQAPQKINPAPPPPEAQQLTPTAPEKSGVSASATKIVRTSTGKLAFSGYTKQQIQDAVDSIHSLAVAKATKKMKNRSPNEIKAALAKAEFKPKIHEADGKGQILVEARKGQAIIPMLKDHENALRTALEQSAPSKKPQKASSDLLQRIKQLGGIDGTQALDITGEPRGVGGWKFAFKKGGTGLDDLATQLALDGFNIDTSDVDGGVQQLRDMIRSHIGGERNFKAASIEAAAEKESASRDMDVMAQRADEMGINWRNLSAQQLSDAVYEAEDALEMERLDDELALDDVEREAFSYQAADETITDEELDIPFGDNIPVDQAAMDAHFNFGANNEEINDGQADGATRSEQAQGAERSAPTGAASQADQGEILQSYTAAEVAQREAAQAAQEAAQKAEEDAAKAEQAKKDQVAVDAKKKAHAANPENFVFGESKKDAVKPMGNLWDQQAQPTAESKAESRLDKKIQEATDKYASTDLTSLSELSTAELDIVKRELRAWLSDELIAKRIPSDEAYKKLLDKVNAITSSVPAEESKPESIKLTGHEFGDNLHGKELREAASAYARAQFVGKSYRNGSTQNDIEVTWQGIKHAVAGANDIELRAIHALPDILKSAEFVATEQDNSNRPGIIAAHKYQASVSIAGENLTLGVVVLEKADGHKFYDQFVIKEKTPTGTSEAASASGEKLGVQPSVGAVDNISQPAAESKPTQEQQATAILDRANVTGKDRLDIMRDFKDGKHSLADLEAAYQEPKAEPSREQLLSEMGIRTLRRELDNAEQIFAKKPSPDNATLLAQAKDRLKAALAKEQASGEGAQKAAGDVQFNTGASSIGMEPIAAEDFDREIKRLTAGWNALSQNRIVVIDDLADIPADILAAANDLGYPVDIIKGFVRGGYAYIVRVNHFDLAEVEETLFHESYGHLGARAILGKEFVPALNDFWLRAGGTKGVLKIARSYGLESEVSGYMDEMVGLDGYNRAQKQAKIVDELIAHAATSGDIGIALKAFLGKIKAALFSFAKAHNWNGLADKLDSFTDLDLAVFLQEAKQAVIEGKTSDGKDVAFMVAWHGSPHDHDKFDSSKIGTGEGAAAYGHGLYFAGNKEVAEYYKDALINKSRPASIQTNIENVAWQTVRSAPEKSNKELIKFVKAPFENISDEEAIEALETGRKALQAGKLYQVELAPKEDEYLLWDKPLSEQSEKVKAAILDDLTKQINIAPYKLASEMARDSFKDEHLSKSASTYYKELGRMLAPDPGTIGYWSDGDKAASEHLHSIGIRGIKYLDGSSRNKGDGNFNYVIFDDKDVSITAKFSLSNDIDEQVHRLQDKYNIGRDEARQMYEAGDRIDAKGKKYDAGMYSQSATGVVNPFTLSTLTAAIDKAMGQGFAGLLKATGKFKLIESSQIGKYLGDGSEVVETVPAKPSATLSRTQAIEAVAGSIRAVTMDGRSYLVSKTSLNKMTAEHGQGGVDKPHQKERIVAIQSLKELAESASVIYRADEQNDPQVDQIAEGRVWMSYEGNRYLVRLLGKIYKAGGNNADKMHSLAIEDVQILNESDAAQLSLGTSDGLHFETGGEQARGTGVSHSRSATLNKNNAPDIRFSQDGRILAFVKGSHTYLVADNISSTDDNVKGLLTHEVALHALQLGRSEPEFQAILKQFTMMGKMGNEKVKAAQARVPADTPAHLVEEESLGYYLEAHPDTTFAQKVVAWFRTQLRKLGNKLPMVQRMQWFRWADKLQAEDIVYIASQALRSAPQTLATAQDRGTFLAGASDKLYSQLRVAIRDMNDKIFQGSAQNVKLHLMNNLGKYQLKRDEIFWTGLEDFLNISGKVSKVDVLGFLDENAVQVKDEWLGDVDLADVESWWNDEGGANEETPFSELSSDEQAEATSRYKDEVAQYDENSTNTKFPTQVLPGGRDYRELLITLPTDTGTDQLRRMELAGIDRSRSLTASEQAEYDRLNSDKSLSKQNFKSSHYPYHPNLIAHVRLNTRDDAQGRVGTFLEEQQSDWGIAGSKSGFIESALTPEQQEMKALNAITWTNAKWTPAQEARAKELRAKGVEQSLIDRANKGGVPPAPFVTSATGKGSTAHTLLSLKKTILYAIEQGHEFISWTTGKQQADRYDLSKQVDEVTATPIEGGYHLTVTDKNGNKVTDRRYDTEQLPEVVGKELADKIVKNKGEKLVDLRGENPEYVYRGLDLKVGGEWADALYGDENGLDANGKPSLMSQAVKEVARQLGIELKVEPIDIFGKPKQPEFIAPGIGINKLPEGNQPGFTITPELRSKVTSAGIPLFSKKPTEAPLANVAAKSNQTGTPEFKRWFGDWEVLRRQSEWKAAIDRALDDAQWQKRTVLAEGYDADPSGKLSETFGFKVERQYLTPDDIRKSDNKHGGSNEKFPDQVGLNHTDYVKALEVLRDPETFKKTTSRNGKPSAEFSRRFEDGTIVVAEVEASEDGAVSVKSVWKKVPGRIHAGASTYPNRTTSESAAGDGSIVHSDTLIVNPDSVSKVVDANGKPLILYHGTLSDFTEFKSNKLGLTFATEDKPSASSYAAKYSNYDKVTQQALFDGGMSPNVMPVYVRANYFDYKNKDHVASLLSKLEIDDKGYVKVTYDGVPSNMHTRDFVKGDWVAFENPEVISALKSLGFDAMKIQELGIDNFAIFSPTQIKSAIGNNGQFNPSNPDILRSKASNKPIEGMSVQRVQRATAKLRASWHGFKHVNIVQSVKDLPTDFRHVMQSASNPIIDLSKDERFSHLFYGNPTDRQVKEFGVWLKNNPDAVIRMYHGSAAINKIKEQGIRKTSSQLRNSLQSGSGFVYLSVYHGMAKTFADFGAANRGIAEDGKKAAVYSVDLRVSELLADTDQLRNQRLFAEKQVGNTLAESLVYGHGAKVKGNIAQNRISGDIRYSVNQNTEGFYDPKTNSVYLIADNIATPDRAVWVAIHETVVHGGIRMLGAPVVESLNHAAKNGFVTKLANAIAADRGETFDAKTHTDEAIAELAAATITGKVDAIMDRYGIKVPMGMRSNLLGMIKRVVDAVRNFIGRVTGKPVEEVSDGEVLGLIRRMKDAVEGVEQGYDTAGVSNGVLASLPSAKDAFVSALGRWFSMPEKFRASGLPIIVGETPFVLKQVGAEPHPISIDRGTLIKVTRAHGDLPKGHGITKEQLEQLPDALANPLAIFESAPINGVRRKDGRVVLTAMKDGQGERVVVAIHLSKSAGRSHTINDISSVHGRGDAEIKRWVDSGLTLYFDDTRNKTSPEWLTTGRLELPAVVQAAQSLGNKVLLKSEIVKDTDAPLFSSAPKQQSQGKKPNTTLKQRYIDQADRVINRMDSAINGLGDMPDQAQYLAQRYLALGKISQVDEVAGNIRKAFKGIADFDKKAIYEYLTTRGATPDGILNRAARDMAVKAKKYIGTVGDEMVKRGLIPQTSRDEYNDRYLPRLYLAHLLDDSSWRAIGGGKKVSDQGYLKQRNNELPEEYRKVILGEVTDPAFLAASAIAQPMRDMAIIDWLEQVGKNEKWIWPNQMVEWNGQNVSAHWLQAESDALLARAQLYEDAADKKKAEAIATEMRKKSLAAMAGMPREGADYKRIPNSPRYGRLRGLMVRSEIHNDLVGLGAGISGDAGWAEKMLGHGGVGTKVQQVWKTAKVALNPSGQIRNFVSNMVAIQLSGVPLHSIPTLFVRAVKQISSNGKYWQEAKKYGVTASTFTAQELYRAKNDLIELERQMNGIHPFLAIQSMAAHVMDMAGDAYQWSESIMKTVKIMDAMEREGMTGAQAALEAQKWLFDYSLVNQNIRYVRNAPVGAPFVTYQAKILPRIMEVAAKHPQRFLPWAMLFYGLGYAAMSALGGSDDDWDKLKQDLPEWLRKKPHAVPLPWRDSNGRIQFTDIGYFFPWSNYAEIGSDLYHGEIMDALHSANLMGGPLSNIISAFSTNTDSFTKRQIVDKGDPPMEQTLAVMNYVWNMAAPPFLTANGFLSPMGAFDKQYGGKLVQGVTGTTNKYGDEKATVPQAVTSLFGANIQGINPDVTRMQNMQKMNYDILDVFNKLKLRLQDQSLSAEQRNKIIKDYQDEMVSRQKKAAEYEKSSRVPEFARPTYHNGARH